MTPTRTFLATALIGAFAWLLISQNKAGKPVANATPTAPAISVPVAPAAVVVETVPETIRRVLPSITGKVHDWRQFTPETITISPLPGIEIPFHVAKVTKEDGITTWIGRNGLQGAFLVGIGKADRWDGVLNVNGSSFDIHIYGEKVRVIEHSEPITCATVPPVSSPDYKAFVTSADAHASSVAPTGNPGVHVSGSTIHTVNVAFYYAQDGAAQAATVSDGADVQSYLDSTYRAYITANNLVLEQSLVANMRWHFVGMFRTPDEPLVLAPGWDGTTPVYSTGNDLRLMRMQESHPSSGDGSTPFGQFIADTNAANFVDQTVLVAGYQRDASGAAEGRDIDAMTGKVKIGQYSIVTLASLYGVLHTVIGGGHMLVAHEMGHNFGLYHDRITDAIPDSDTSYKYGYKFTYDASAYSNIPFTVVVGDVMSYSTTIPYYSSPNILVNGTVFAVGTNRPDNNTYILGIAEGQPKAADAARWLSEHAAEMAANRQDPTQTFPSVTVQPVLSRTVSVGGSITLSATAAGTNLSYQWRKNGADIAGATGGSYVKANATTADAGSYDVMVTNTLGSVITRAASIAVTTQPLSARLVNISTRSLVGADASVQIAGFVISGSTPKMVLIRAGGAALTAAGLQGVLTNPTLELHDAHNTIGFNDDWSTDTTAADAIRSAALQVGASPWATGSKDAAILVTLNPGLYSAVVAGKNGTTGSAIVEVYEVTETGGNVVNISTRSPVGAADNVQIAGFVISGTGSKTVLIRAGGAALAAAGLQGSLANPVIELHDSQTTIATNDDWSSDSTSADAIRSAALQVGASPWATGSKDAALLVTLNPGVYSAVVSGKAGTSGLAIVEVYDVGQ